MTLTPALFALGLVLILVASLFVVGPLFRPARAAGPDDDASERARWERQKRQALAAIREAEMDHQMGKLSDDDLATLRGRFEDQALAALAALEKEGRG
jgi:hypothetical protein